MSRIINIVLHPRVMLRRLVDDRRGVTAIMTALALTVLTGFAGLAIDVVYWQSNQRNMQGVADQAAYSAAVAANYVPCSGSGAAVPPSSGYYAALGVTANAHFVNGQNATTVTVNCPPSSGTYSSNTGAWEVIVSQTQPMWFANLFLSTAPSITARSVSLGATSVSDLCVLSLDPSSGSTTTQIGGSDTMVLHCGMAVDATYNQGFKMTGSSSMTATDLYLVASGYQKSSSASLTVTNGINESQPPVMDPYAGVSSAIPSSIATC